MFYLFYPIYLYTIFFHYAFQDSLALQFGPMGVPGPKFENPCFRELLDLCEFKGLLKLQCFLGKSP